MDSISNLLHTALPHSYQILLENASSVSDVCEDEGKGIRSSCDLEQASFHETPTLHQRAILFCIGILSSRAFLGGKPSTRRTLSVSLNIFLSLGRGLSALLPSFITVFWPWQKRDDAKRISPTAYLNGVRGIAAYSVYWQHFLTIFFHGDRLFAWHARPQDNWIIQFPIISLLHSGMFPVTTFFILSGFVLSYRPLQYVRSRNYEAVLKNLSSSVFRRGLRLFLPLIPPLFFIAVCVHYNFDGHGGQPTLYADLEIAFWQFERLVNFFDTNLYFPGPDPPLCK